MVGEQGRILVAEDDASGVVIRFNLQRAGFEAVLARNETEAWELLQRREFDLLIAEGQMPDMSGLRLCRRVRGAAGLAELPIVLLTDGGREEEQDLQRFAPLEVIRRPLKPCALIDRVWNLLAMPPANSGRMGAMPTLAVGMNCGQHACCLAALA
jgi:two-component system phosphate regulon response regulator PhoB